MKSTAIASLLFGLALSVAGDDLSGRGMARVTREVRHELVTLPYYGVFDNLAYQVSNDGTVTLVGQVTRPTLKSDAEKAVRDIEGVTKVVNQLEVLPLSSSDDQLRLALYRAIYSTNGLTRYAMQAVPPIHIIVRNGNATLEGVAATEADKNLAGIQANTVPGVFSVKNNLRVEADGSDHKSSDHNSNDSSKHDSNRDEHRK